LETRGFEERALARVSKDEAAALSNALATPKEK
jgi:hypothetical protein